MTTSQYASDKALHWAEESDRRIRTVQEIQEKAVAAAGEPGMGWRFEQQTQLAGLELELADRARLQALLWVQVEPLLPAAIEAPGIRTRCMVCGCIDAVCAKCRQDCAQAEASGAAASPEVAL